MEWRLILATDLAQKPGSCRHPGAGAFLRYSGGDGDELANQPPRFAARSGVIRDNVLDDGSARLYLLLDDIGWDGECLIKQAGLADQLAVSTRTIRDRVSILERTGYVLVDRRQYRTRYVLGWSADRNPASALERQQTGRISPPDRQVSSALSLLSKTESSAEQNALSSKCPNCRGRGLISRIVRGYQVTDFCGCPAGDQRKTA